MYRATFISIAACVFAALSILMRTSASACDDCCLYKVEIPVHHFTGAELDDCNYLKHHGAACIYYYTTCGGGSFCELCFASENTYRIEYIIVNNPHPGQPCDPHPYGLSGPELVLSMCINEERTFDVILHASGDKTFCAACPYCTGFVEEDRDTWPSEMENDAHNWEQQGSVYLWTEKFFCGPLS